MSVVRIWGTLVACLLVLIVIPATTVCGAEPHGLSVAVSQAQVVQFPRPARTVFIADPTIADVQVSSPTNVIVFGKKVGRTTLIAIGEDDKQLASIQVDVGYDFGSLRRLIATEVPNASIDLKSTASGIVISGTAPNDEAAEKARSLVERYAGEKETIVNRLQVSGPAQVNLRLRVAEVSRNVTKQLGFNWEAIVSPGSFAFGLATGRSGFTGTGSALRSPSDLNIDNVISRASPLTGVTAPIAGANSVFGNLTTGHATVNSLIDALAEENVITILAQPNLTAESGQVASFLAGGEFPIPVAQSTSGTSPTITIEFKPFGVRLDFVPTVLSSDRISIKVRPEVSELTTNGAVTLPGNIVVPALNVRRAETTVRLGSGESFAIAGLIRNNTANDINKFPGLGDLPVLGPLFRSMQFQHNETELVIIVTPYVVRPAGDEAQLKLPTDGMQPASDVEHILYDRLTKASPNGAADAARLQGARLQGNVGFIYQ